MALFSIARADIEALFGVDNVAQWSNLDNDDAQAKDSRITSAINYATAWVNDRFRDSRYAVPLSGNSATALDTIKNVASQLAGWWLYRTRGLRDAEEITDKMRTHMVEANKTIDAYLRGSMKLNAALNDSTPTAPVVV